MSDSATRRKAIRQKVSESQADLAKTTPPERNPPEGVKALAMDYPFAILLGGLAVGVVVGAMLPKAAGRRASRKALTAAAVARELALTYGKRAMHLANETAASAKTEGGKILDGMGERLEDLSGTVGEAATGAGQRAADVSSDAAESVRETGMRIARQVIRLTSQLRH